MSHDHFEQEKVVRDKTFRKEASLIRREELTGQRSDASIKKSCEHLAITIDEGNRAPILQEGAIAFFG